MTTRIIEREEFIAELTQRLKACDRLDIIVAWATKNEALKLIVKRTKARRIKLNALVGIDNDITEPDALHDLRRAGRLKIWPKKSGRGIFHEKIYIFRKDERTVLWIGSPNLTVGGFQYNTEVLVECDEDVEGLERLWRQQWGKVKHYAKKQDVQDYAEARRPPQAPPDSRVKPSKIDFGEHPREILLKKPKTWSDYLRGLAQAEVYWRPLLIDGQLDVFGNDGSWLNTIERGHALIRSRRSWTRLDPSDARWLTGHNDRGDYGKGFLGTLRYGKGRQIFTKPNRAKTRNYILAQLRSLLNVPDKKLPEAAERVLVALCGVKGIGGAFASRLIAFARPDYAVSVNAASRDALAKMSGLRPTTLTRISSSGEAENYRALLTAIARLPWQKAGKPRSKFEARVYKVRGALLDVLVYKIL